MRATTTCLLLAVFYLSFAAAKPRMTTCYSCDDTREGCKSKCESIFCVSISPLGSSSTVKESRTCSNSAANDGCEYDYINMMKTCYCSSNMCNKVTSKSSVIRTRRDATADEEKAEEAEEKAAYYLELAEEYNEEAVESAEEEEEEEEDENEENYRNENKNYESNSDSWYNDDDDYWPSYNNDWYFNYYGSNSYSNNYNGHSSSNNHGHSDNNDHGHSNGHSGSSSNNYNGYSNNNYYWYGNNQNSNSDESSGNNYNNYYYYSYGSDSGESGSNDDSSSDVVSSQATYDAETTEVYYYEPTTDAPSDNKHRQSHSTNKSAISYNGHGEENKNHNSDAAPSTDSSYYDASYGTVSTYDNY